MIERSRMDETPPGPGKDEPLALLYVGNSAGLDQYFRAERSILSSRAQHEKSQVLQPDAGGGPLLTGGR